MLLFLVCWRHCRCHLILSVKFGALFDQITQYVQVVPGGSKHQRRGAVLYEFMNVLNGWQSVGI